METLNLCKSTVDREGIHFNDEGDLIIPVRAIPFGNQKSTDLDQQFFDKDTYLGDWKEHLVFFDHDDSWLPEAIRFGNRPIGKSYVTHSDDSGVFEKVVIDRRTKFIKSIHDLFKAGALDISTVAEWGSLDPNIKGRIAEWGWKRTDITPTNSDARATLAKSFEGASMDENTKEKEAGTENQEEKQEEKISVTDNIRKIFADAEKEVQQKLTEQNQSGAEIASVLETVKSGFASVTEKIEALTQKSASIDEINTKIKKISEDIIDLQTAFPELAKSVATRIHSLTAEDLQKSEAERRVEAELRKQAELQKNKSDAGNGRVQRGAPGWEKNQ